MLFLPLLALTALLTLQNTWFSRKTKTLIPDCNSSAKKRRWIWMKTRSRRSFNWLREIWGADLKSSIIPKKNRRYVLVVFSSIFNYLIAEKPWRICSRWPLAIRPSIVPSSETSLEELTTKWFVKIFFSLLSRLWTIWLFSDKLKFSFSDRRHSRCASFEGRECGDQTDRETQAAGLRWQTNHFTGFFF